MSLAINGSAQDVDVLEGGHVPRVNRCCFLVSIAVELRAAKRCALAHGDDSEEG